MSDSTATAASTGRESKMGALMRSDKLERGDCITANREESDDLEKRSDVTFRLQATE
jgi:hypothetical protein